MQNRLAILSISALAACGALTAAHAGEGNDIDILRGYAADFEKDAFLKAPVTFGVEVGEDFYTVEASPADGDKAANVTVNPGAPDAPVFYYTIESSDYLHKLKRGEFNALTLMAKAFSSDVTPMDIDMQEGFQPSEGFVGMVLPLTFHFWTKGKPELIPFGPNMTRETHGSNAGIFFYQPGFRSGWFDIRPGDHVNEDENSRTNPFPSMFIMISGEVTGVIDGEEMSFKAGNAMFVPAGVSHEFINKGDESAFGFLFMFGDGA